MTSAWDRFEARSLELSDLGSAIRLLHWDQAVMLPPKGGAGRARALSTLETMAHARVVDPEVGSLLDELADDDSLDEWQRASVRIFKHDHDKATRVPADLVRALAQVRGDAYQAWTEARPKADFEILRPHLEKLIALRKEEADAVGWEEERYDALLDDFEPFMLTSEVAKMFDDLGVQLKPVAEAILEKVGPAGEIMSKEYDGDTQERFCHWLIEQIGFDMEGGRVDTSPHPFTAGIGPDDVRQTIRMEPANIFASVYAAMHETGHALYEQGIPSELRDLPVGRAPSLGMHESQSRTWENHVGRSREFTSFMLPHIKEYFPEQLDSVSADEFYEAANHPHRSLIRVYADEVTYNLHLVLRFQIELALFRDELDVADLPGVFNEKSEEHLGITPTDDGDGVLQDMHWSIGALGYFPTYTLGTLYAAAFFEKAQAAVPSLPEDLRNGDGSKLLAWLNENIFSKAYLKPGKELGEEVLGGPLTVDPFISYLKTKYGELYDVSF